MIVMVVGVVMPMSFTGGMPVAIARDVAPMPVAIACELRNLVVLPRLAVLLVGRQELDCAHLVVRATLGGIDDLELVELGLCRPLAGRLGMGRSPR